MKGCRLSIQGSSKSQPRAKLFDSIVIPRQQCTDSMPRLVICTNFHNGILGNSHLFTASTQRRANMLLASPSRRVHVQAAHAGHPICSLIRQQLVCKYVEKCVSSVFFSLRFISSRASRPCSDKLNFSDNTCSNSGVLSAAAGHVAAAATHVTHHTPLRDWHQSSWCLSNDIQSGHAGRAS